MDWATENRVSLALSSSKNLYYMSIAGTSERAISGLDVNYTQQTQTINTHDFNNKI